VRLLPEGKQEHEKNPVAFFEAKLRIIKGAAWADEKKGYFGRPDRCESAFWVIHIMRY
jgi:hypothetical protein